MSEPFIGEIRMVGFTFAPYGWADADGQILNTDNYSALYSLYGTTYGGDGKTFRLPDLRGRVAIHCGQGSGLPDYEMGWTGGYPAVTLTADQIPSHTHPATVNARAAEADQAAPTNHYWAQLQRSAPAYSAGHDAKMAADAVQVGASGGGQAHQNMPPYLTIRFCVAMEGIYPRRPQGEGVGVPERPTLDLFAGREGSTFTVVATGIPGAIDRPFGPVELELTRVEDLSTEVIDGFSLLFRGPREQPFGQANYRL